MKMNTKILLCFVTVLQFSCGGKDVYFAGQTGYIKTKADLVKQSISDATSKKVENRAPKAVVEQDSGSIDTEDVVKEEVAPAKINPKNAPKKEVVKLSEPVGGKPIAKLVVTDKNPRFRLEGSGEVVGEIATQITTLKWMIKLNDDSELFSYEADAGSTLNSDLSPYLFEDGSIHDFEFHPSDLCGEINICLQVQDDTDEWSEPACASVDKGEKEYRFKFGAGSIDPSIALHGHSSQLSWFYGDEETRLGSLDTYRRTLTGNEVHRLKVCPGLVKDLKIYNNNLLESPDYNDFVNLDTLQLSGNTQYAKKIDKNTFKDLRKLSRLTLNRLPGVGTPDADAFADLDNLTYFQMVSSDVKRHHREWFSNKKKIEYVSLYSNRITEVEPGSFDGSPELKNVWFAGNQISRLDKDLFKLNPKLERLMLYRNNLASLDDSIFSNLPALKWLHLGFNQLSEIKAKLLVANEKLKSLNIASNAISRIEPGSFDNQKDLEELVIYGNSNLSQLDVNLFSNLKMLSKLRAYGCGFDLQALNSLFLSVESATSLSSPKSPMIKISPLSTGHQKTDLSTEAQSALTALEGRSWSIDW